MPDNIAYHGFPGGRPAWPFARPSKPVPVPVTVPTGLYAVEILRLVANGVNTARLIAPQIGVKYDSSASPHIRALECGGYIERTPQSNGRTDRLLSLTDKGRKALELAR